MTKKAAMRDRKTRRQLGAEPTEHHEQAALVRWLALKGIGCFAVPNGAHLGGRSYAQAARLKAEGLRPGAPDLVLTRLSPGGSPVVVEMKRRSGARTTDGQLAVQGELRAAGWHVLVCYGCDDAIEQVSRLYGLRR